MDELTPESVRVLLAEATPGPWRAVNEMDGRGEVEAQGTIAAWEWVSYPEDGEQIDIGDARLIAAAPDLAEALLKAWERIAELEEALEDKHARLDHQMEAASAWCEEHSLESDLALAAVLAALVAGWDEARRRAAFYEDAAYSLLDHHKHGSDRDAEYARLVAGPGEPHE